VFGFETDQSLLLMNFAVISRDRTSKITMMISVRVGIAAHKHSGCEIPQARNGRKKIICKHLSTEWKNSIAKVLADVNCFGFGIRHFSQIWLRRRQ